jgi:hypothetical protein
MPNKSQYEDRGIGNKKSKYTNLGKTWEYSCPTENTNYVGFNKRGLWCMDNKREEKKDWPIGNPDLGWKKS